MKASARTNSVARTARALETFDHLINDHLNSAFCLPGQRWMRQMGGFCINVEIKLLSSGISLSAQKRAQRGPYGGWHTQTLR